MSVSATSAIGFGVIIKGNDTGLLERLAKVGDTRDYPFEDVLEILKNIRSEHLLVDVAGSTMLGYEENDLVLVVADTYRDFNIMSSGFAGVFRIGEDGVSDEGIAELRAFCESVGLEATASWLAWNTAS